MQIIASLEFPVLIGQCARVCAKRAREEASGWTLCKTMNDWNRLILTGFPFLISVDFWENHFPRSLLLTPIALYIKGQGRRPRTHTADDEGDFLSFFRCLRRRTPMLDGVCVGVCIVWLVKVAVLWWWCRRWRDVASLGWRSSWKYEWCASTILCVFDHIF